MEKGYILASDPVLQWNAKQVRMVRPKPSPRSYVFRHPSETREQRPAPRPLPRTFSSPLGERPLHLSARSASSSRNYNTKGYADFNLCSADDNTEKQSVSLQHRREVCCLLSKWSSKQASSILFLCSFSLSVSFSQTYFHGVFVFPVSSLHY